MSTVDYLLTPGAPELNDTEVESILQIAGNSWPISTARSLPYHDYLTTPYWKYIARKTKEKDHMICRTCGSGQRLVAHHIGYAHLGNEHRNMHRMTCLCHSCHEKYHDVNPPALAPAPVTATYGQGMAKAAATKTVGDEMVIVTKAIAKQMTGWKEQWHWLKEHGINPRKRRWQRDVIGMQMPIRLLGRCPYAKAK